MKKADLKKRQPRPGAHPLQRLFEELLAGKVSPEQAKEARACYRETGREGDFAALLKRLQALEHRVALCESVRGIQRNVTATPAGSLRLG